MKAARQRWPERLADMASRLEFSLGVLRRRLDEVIEETNNQLPHRTGTLMVRANPCGKPGCLSCPHGPYWYRMVRTRDGKWRSHYIGMEPSEDDIKIAEAKRRVVKEAILKLARLRKQKARLTAALPRAYRLLVLAEREAMKFFISEQR